MRQTEGVINLKLTNSKNKVMASSHLHPPPIFPVFLEAAVHDMDERDSSIIVAFKFLITSPICSLLLFNLTLFSSFNYPFAGLYMLYSIHYLSPFTCIHLRYLHCVCQRFFFSPGSKALIQAVYCT